MHSTLRSAGKILIIGFFLWHACAIAIYTVPRDAQDPFAQWVRLDLLPRVTPYMLTSSQWQLWNLFSPNPQRRVTYYRVEVWNGQQWRHVLSLEPGTFSLFRHATRFKLYSNMLDEYGNNRIPRIERFLDVTCVEHGIPAGVPVRLVYYYFIIPEHEARQSTAWWNAWRPEIQNYVGHQTSCFRS